MNRQTHTLQCENGSQPVLEPHSGISGEAQLSLDFYAGPPDPHEAPYLAFSMDTSEEEARRLFRERIGRPAEHVFVSLGNRLAGPKPAEVSL